MLLIPTLFFIPFSQLFHSKHSEWPVLKRYSECTQIQKLIFSNWPPVVFGQAGSFWFYFSLEISTLEICCCPSTTEVNELLFVVLTGLKFIFKKSIKMCFSVSADCLHCGSLVSYLLISIHNFELCPSIETALALYALMAASQSWRNNWRKLSRQD